MITNEKTLLTCAASGHVIKKDLVWYLASPFTHPDKDVEAQRLATTKAITKNLLYMGYNVVSPIVYITSMIDTGTFKEWARFDLELLERCDGILACTIEGYTESKGMELELLHAVDNDMYLYFLDPKEVLQWRDNA